MHYPTTKTTIITSIALSIGELYAKLVLASKTPGLTYAEAEVPYFVAIPAQIWRYPWTILTAAFTGRRLLLSLFQTLFLFLALSFFERAWGSRSLAKYVLLVSVVPVLVAVGVDAVLAPQDTVGGSAPLVVAFLVALKQANPFTYLLGGVEIKPKYLVMPALAFYTAFGLLDASVTIMAWTSLVVAWWYLRFIKSLVMDQLLDGPQVQKGDRSDSFRFAAFFYPRRVTAAVDALVAAMPRGRARDPVFSDADRQRRLGEEMLRG